MAVREALTPGRRVVEHQLWHGHEAIAVGRRPLITWGRVREGLRAVAAAIVHEHGPAWTRLADGSLDDRLNPGTCVVLGNSLAISPT